MDTSLIIVFIGLLIFGAHLFNGLFKFTKIPNVLLLLIIGILLGPILGMVSIRNFGSVGPIFTTITLIVLLFESGTNLKIGSLINSIGSAFLLTLFNFVASAIIGTAVAYTFFDSLEIISASFFGVIIAGTSSAVVIPMINQLKINEKASTTLLLESALSDVLCLVIGLALLQAMKLGIFELSAIVTSIWQSFLFAMLGGFIAGIVWSIILQRTRIVQNSIIMNLAFVFIVYGLTEHFNFNGGIAVLIFGITLGNAHLMGDTILKSLLPSEELRQNEKDFFSELAFLLSTFFFVYVGICMEFGSIQVYLIALMIVVLIVLARPTSIKLLVDRKMSFKDLGIMSIMAPKGLVPAILASIPIQLGLAGGKDIQDLSYAVVLLSIVICSGMVIMLSSNPFSIGYLSTIFGKDEEETSEDHVQPYNSNLKDNTPGDEELK